jgi:carbamoyltransferase
MVSLGIVAKSTRSGFCIKNGSATLIDGNEIIASVAEERITRLKSSHGCEKGADYLISSLLNGDAPEHVVISTCCEHAEDAYSDDLGNSLFLQNRIVRSPSHHFSHALMAYYLSPFERAIVAVIDAGGNTNGVIKSHEWWTLPREQASFYLAEGNQIKLVHSCFGGSQEWGIGEAYRAFTKFLGLGGQTNSGKTMGLAGFSSPPDNLVPLFELASEGQLRSRLTSNSPWEIEEGVERFLAQSGIHIKRRQRDDALLESHATVASIIQSETERAILHVIRYLVKKHSVKNVCFSGGVALNIPTNTKILNLSEVSDLFVPPCPGDDGQSIGNALLPLFQSRQSDRPTINFTTAFLGLNNLYTIDEILSEILSATSLFEVLDDDEYFGLTSKLISQGLILGWFHGRSEIGPRALGHRSILGDPRRRDVRERLSRWIKGRDPFRPFAASVLSEDAKAWFDLKGENPFMLFSARMLDHTKRAAPALFHPDDYCRVQTVNDSVPELRNCLKSFKKLTGLPFVLNSSLNLAGMPIAESPKDALYVLNNSDLDGLVIGSKVIQKRRRSIPTEFVKVPEISFQYGDLEAEATLKLVYPGVPTTYRNYFGLYREYCDWILLGRKTTTVRYASGCIDLPTDRILDVIARPGGETVYALEIKRIRVIPFGNLRYEDARRDGFTSLSELKDALGRFYGGILDLSPITVYEVEVMKGFDSLRGRSLFG